MVDPRYSSSATSMLATSSWQPSGNKSAYIGDPPNTQRDYYIVRGLLRAIGMTTQDPAEGYVVAAVDTGEDFTSKRPAVIAGLIIVLVAITTVTGSRLVMRASVSQMRFGADDWATIAAAVCAASPLSSLSLSSPDTDCVLRIQAMGLTYTTCQLIMAIKGGGDHIVSVLSPSISTPHPGRPVVR